MFAPGAAHNIGSLLSQNSGTIALFGAPKTSWARLAGSGTTRIVVTAVQGWQVGDQIAVAPTGYDPAESEQATISSVDCAAGTTCTLGLAAPGLGFSHNAAAYSVQHGGNGKTMTLDARAEVAMLTK